MVIKNKLILSALFIFTILIQVHTARALTSATITVSPDVIVQGDPVMISVSNSGSDNVDNKLSLTDIKSATIGKTKLSFFNYKNVPTALYGVDINQYIGTSTVTVKFKDGTSVKAEFHIAARPRPTEFLAVPKQLGGNSASNQAKVVSILNKENSNLSSLISRATKALWDISPLPGINSFKFPVASTTKNPVVITDTYGYTRDSGSQAITHKGADFQAASGTPVYAISGGKVLATKKYVTYGNTIIIDHGLGLLSMYMHLSKISVTANQIVKTGQIIGYSGETGYSEGPHLHLTIRINGISIDPIKFYKLFGVNI